MKSKTLPETVAYECRLVQFINDIVKISMKRYRISVIYNGISESGAVRRVGFLLLVLVRVRPEVLYEPRSDMI